MQFLSSFGSVLLILFGFGVLIFVHEMGHFLAAKWAGIRTEGFAVGMGPVALAWRRGIGTTIGSTEKKVVALTGKPAQGLSDAELEKHGLGETEYSLRYLPLGGFVKMLGQEDLVPTETTNDPRSYMSCPVGKRMIVVSAGVIMNILLALVLFVVAFLGGVKFEAPVIGGVRDTLPAGTTMADNAAALGVTEPGLKSGDVVLTIDDDEALTFADIQIAIAMSRPGRPVRLAVERRDVPEPLLFSLRPQPGSQGLLSIGIDPELSTRVHRKPEADVRRTLATLGLTGVEPGMRIIEANGAPVSTHSAFDRAIAASKGAPVPVRWSAVDDDGTPIGAVVDTVLEPLALYARYRSRATDNVEPPLDEGLLGLTPLVEIASVLDGSPNAGIFEPGDVIRRLGDVVDPRFSRVSVIARVHAGGTVPVEVMRGDTRIEMVANVNREGQFGIGIRAHEALPVTAAPLETHLVAAVPSTTGGEDGEEAPLIDAPTPIAGHDILAGTRIDAVGDRPVSSWPEFRAALRAETAAALARRADATVELAVTHPTPGAETERIAVALSAAEVEALHGLGWVSPLPPTIFQREYATLSAHGNPLTAVAMGFRQTHKMIVMTYLTIDRLFRGSVGVDQLRGPVGIIDLGSKILPRGFMYFLFFLGMISVNLAVINFLPLPIVDGGLFLFLIYEKLKGQPPSVRFQNAATVIGLCLIGTIFLVTFYNDIMRLI